MRPAILSFLLLLSACAIRREPEPVLPEEGVLPEAPPAPRLRIAASVPVEGLLAAACDPAGCARVDARGLATFDPGSLAAADPPLPLPVSTEALLSVPGGFWAEGTCGGAPCAVRIAGGAWAPADPAPEPAPAGAGPEEVRAWTRILGQGWRIPFARGVPLRDGVLTWSRGFGPGSARLMRTGGRLRFASTPEPAGPVTAEGWLCPHPSGTVAWLLLWPEPVIRALDGGSLRVLAEVALPGPAIGLFLDPGGRWLLLGRTAAPDPDRLQDWPARALAADPGRDPLLSGWRSFGPPMEGVLVVDGLAGGVAASVEGAFRAWIPRPDGAILLATDRVLVRLEPQDPGSSPRPGEGVEVHHQHPAPIVVVP